MLNFNNVNFITSRTTQNDGSIKILPEVVFVGKSNVGKSSLINAVTNRKRLAYTSGKPGFTKLLNYYEVDDTFYIVDAPGYGFATKGRKLAESFGLMMEEYFHFNNALRHVLFLVDSRHAPSDEDLDFLRFVTNSQYSFTLIFTKSDKLNQKQRAAALKNYQTYFKEFTLDYLFTSSTKNTSIDKLRELIASLV